MGSEHGSVGVESAAFARTLDTLKREGSNVLLVGANASEAHEAACQRLCGPHEVSTTQDQQHQHQRRHEHEHEHRYHLFVTGRSEQSVGPADPDGAVERVERIRYVGEAADSHADGHASPEALASEIIDTISELDTAANGFEPSELRVCVDSLVRLLQDHDAETVFRLLHITTSGVEHVNGMGHYHLTLDRDHEAVTLLEPLFDAVVELRSSDGSHEQRWHLRDQGSTDWVTI